MPDFVYNIPREILAVYFSSGAAIVMFLGLIFIKPFLRLLVGGMPPPMKPLVWQRRGSACFMGYC